MPHDQQCNNRDSHYVHTLIVVVSFPDMQMHRYYYYYFTKTLGESESKINTTT